MSVYGILYVRMVRLRPKGKLKLHIQILFKGVDNDYDGQSHQRAPLSELGTHRLHVSLSCHNGVSRVSTAVLVSH